MRPRGSDLRVGLAIAIVLAAMIGSGCALSIKYSYDVGATFPEFKTYQWAASTENHLQDPLLETNVQFFADRDLTGKGLARKPDAADMVIWTSYDVGYKKNYEVRMLTLNIARADNREVIWRGTAAGTIKTDAASNEVEGIVTNILSSFPPQVAAP